MAFGDFLEGVGRAGRATAIGALKGRRQALDRKEEERQAKARERQADIQNELMQQLRTAQTDQIAAQKEDLEQQGRDRAAEVADIRKLFPDQFGPDVSDANVLFTGRRLIQEEETAAERTQSLAEIRARQTGGGGAPPQSPEAKAEETRVSAARVDISDALTAVSRIFNPANQMFSNLSDEERAKRADREARNRGFDGMPDLIAKAREIQTGEPQPEPGQRPPAFTPPDPTAPVGTGTVLLPGNRGVPQGRERSEQELWDAAAAELGSPEAATARLGPRPTG